jgi:predicted membrane protein
LAIRKYESEKKFIILLYFLATCCNLGLNLVTYLFKKIFLFFEIFWLKNSKLTLDLANLKKKKKEKKNQHLIKISPQRKPWVHNANHHVFPI